jgi:hypothetical protein
MKMKKKIPSKVGDFSKIEEISIIVFTKWLKTANPC